MPSYAHRYILTLIFSIVSVACFLWFVPPFADALQSHFQTNEPTQEIVGNVQKNIEGEYILIHLEQMTVELRDGTTTLSTMPIITQGKPGSYYETIGGYYTNDYTIRNHFSSLGHVYMPWSVHVFGNFFIHGIPYYPDGQKVSSTYSGGCIRLTDENAEKVYRFVTKGMPIIITRGTEYDFQENTSSEKVSFESIDMPRHMVAIISLDVLSQDNEFVNHYTGELTTRKKLLPKLLIEKDDRVSTLYANALGKAAFIEYMNQKARAIGLHNTTFSDITGPVVTTEEDHAKLTDYIHTYKSYLNTLETVQ